MISTPAGRLRIGTSGYQYAHWKTRFYPEDLPQREWFRYYAEHFDTVEVNNTFYRLPAARTFDAWRASAPEGFEYALKFSRYGSHLKHLRDAHQTIPRYLEAASRLQEHLGPILVQLPPQWRADPERLEAFLHHAPKEHRWAVEFRNEEWLNQQVFDVLREHGAALCVHDMIPDHPRLLTTGWAYLRFHGGAEAGSYPARDLKAEAERIAGMLREGCDVYTYFNNDQEGHAVRNARDLKRYVHELAVDNGH